MRKFNKNSLALKIAVAYIFLTLVNLTFFSVIIVENQTDLIITNFKHQAESLAKATIGSLAKLKIRRIKDKDYNSLREYLKSYDLNWYRIFDRNGKVWHQYTQPGTESQANREQPKKKEILQRIQQLDSKISLFQTRYLLEIKEEGFGIEILLPLQAAKRDGKIFLLASLSLQEIQQRLAIVYYQVAGALIWGIIFHVLFAAFLVRVIFRRIALLISASQKMKEGDLSARTNWKIKEKKQDELDVLGTSFNSMAASVEEKIITISKLNKQIQQELKIGKEVQEILGSTSKDIIADFKPQLYFRPLREVSGDMCHYFKFSNNHYGVFFADASGHGVSAALVTAISYLSLESILSRNIAKEKIMDVLNTSIASRMQQSFYLTAVFMIFDNNGQLLIANAGHNDFFILPKAEQKILTVEAEGLPIGVLPDSTYSLRKYSVKSGDRVFIYTDGLVETKDKEDNEFSLQRVRDILSDNFSQSTEVLATQVKEQFESFAHSYADDVTFLILEVP